MTKPVLEMTCSICKESPPVFTQDDLSGWAPLVAYDNVEWSAESSPSPTLEFERIETAPVVESEHLIRVHGPFIFPEPGYTPWFLFRSGLSSWDGWDEYPDQIPLSTFARVSLVDLLSVGEHSAWLKVRVIESLPITEIVTRFPAYPPPPPFGAARDLLQHDDGPRRWIVKHGEFALVSYDGEGDVGEWGLFQRHESRWRMLCHNHMACGYDYTLVGHLLLNEEDLGRYGLV